MAQGSPSGAPIPVGLAIAEMMSMISNTSEQAEQSQKNLNQQYMEQSIAQAIQAMESDEPNLLAALNGEKNFLQALSEQLQQPSAQGQSWDSGVEAWITGELQTADSYQTDPSLLSQLATDQENLQSDESQLTSDTSNMNACQTEMDKLEAKLSTLKSEIGHAGFWKSIELAFEIAGVGIAIGAVATGYGACWCAVQCDKNSVNSDESALANVENEINNDPKIKDYLNMMSTGSSMVENQATAGIDAYKACTNVAEYLDSQVNAFAKALNSSTNSAA